MNLTLAVVVPCYNCAAILERCVASILDSARACPAFTGVYLVDGGSTDATSDLCARLAASDARVHVLQHPVGTASAKRNRALRDVTADYLVFTDPDCIVSPAWLPEMSQAMGRWRCCAGRVMPTGGRWNTAVRTGIENRTYRPGLWRRATAFRAATSNNLMIARALLGTLGGFPEDLGPGAANGVAEDTEVVYKALRAGVPVRYFAAAAVLHETAPDEAAFLAKKTAYAYGVHFFLARRYLTDPATWLNLAAMLTYSGLRLAAFGAFSSFQRRWAWRELSGRLRGFRHGWHARAAGKSD